MKTLMHSFVAGCVLSIALLGVGCMSEEDLEGVHEQADGDESVEPATIDENQLDPELAMTIAQDKIARTGADVRALRHAPCGTAGPDLDTQRTDDASSPNAVNQRSGSSTGCTAVGALQPSDDAQYFCFTVENGGSFTWTYLQNVRTGVVGWVRDDLLRDRGSFADCDL
jgi:hypothetical protein